MFLHISQIRDFDKWEWNADFGLNILILCPYIYHNDEVSYKLEFQIKWQNISDC